MVLFSSSGLRFKILLPIGMGLCIMCIGGFLAIFMVMQSHLDDMIEEKIASSRQLFKELIEIESDNLQVLAESYTENISYQKAFMDNNRELLFQKSSKTMTRLRHHFKITHLYFHSLDGVCFLRAHDPGRYGDEIKRHTMQQALVTGTASRGYELGPLGTLTLRVVVPWVVDNKLVGYIELGKELDTFLPTMQKLKGVDLILALEKQYLKRDLWEEGLKAMNKTGNWDLFQDHIIAKNTLDEIPEDLGAALSYHAKKHELTSFDLFCDNCKYRVAALPMIQANGKEVGDLFVFVELEGKFTGSNAFLFIAITFSILVLLLYLLFSFYLGRVDEELKSKERTLSEEIKNHVATEKELANHQAKLDELIKDKTDALSKARAEVSILSGFLPICAKCKNIRNEQGEWEQIESYIRDHSEAEFSHSYCPECAKKMYSEYRK